MLMNNRISGLSTLGNVTQNEVSVLFISRSEEIIYYSQFTFQGLLPFYSHEQLANFSIALLNSSIHLINS